MLWNASGLTDYRIEATDGSIGSANDFLFDDREWTIRWLVVDTGTLVPGRRVLLPASAMRSPEAAERVLRVEATRQQVKDSPDISSHPPVSRQQEVDIYGYYGWDPYWAGYIYAPAGGVAAPVPPSRLPQDRPERQEEAAGDPNLRSSTEVTGYYVKASDGDIGHVEDFLIDSDTWIIRYVVVDTKNWWPGKKVLVAPEKFTSVSWSDRTVHVDLNRDQIRNGPEYKPTQGADRAYEERYRDYYALPYYWAAPRG